jgi:hypothetical protein
MLIGEHLTTPIGNTATLEKTPPRKKRTAPPP